MLPCTCCGRAGVQVDFHLSGAMTNRLIAGSATPASPYTLKVSDMFSAMPYENSLLVLKMNGPQLKAVLERAYRNYYYYKYVPEYGGYSYYTTCMLDTDKNNVITYVDLNPALPNGNNVASLMINGVPVDFTDATKFYNVSTVNYLAAGSCNFNDAGVTLWPLNQVVADTQLYVRDAVIDYVKAQTAPIAPAIEGRLQFLTAPPPPPVTKTFAATADAAISSHMPNYSYGKWFYLYAGENDATRSALKFDVTSIDPAFPVDKATLWVYLESYSGGGSPGKLAAFEITKPWNETTVTWKTPWTVHGGNLGAAAVGSTPIDKTEVGSWKKIDITPLVQKWVMSPAANTGVMIRLTEWTSYSRFRFWSREPAWAKDFAPKLEVTYRMP